MTVIYVFNIQMWTNLVCRNGGIRGLPPIELQPLQQGDRSNSCRDLGMIDDDLKPELKPEEAKPLTSAPPKLRPRTHADNALPSRSRAFRKTAPPKPELKPEEKENIHEKEEEEAEVQLLWLWSTCRRGRRGASRGMPCAARAHHRQARASCHASLTLTRTRTRTLNLTKPNLQEARRGRLKTA